MADGSSPGPSAPFFRFLPCSDPFPAPLETLPPPLSRCAATAPPGLARPPSGRDDAVVPGLCGWSLTLMQPAVAATVITATANRAGTGNWRTVRTSGGNG
ncbi:hypothetical protein [Streptomyces sp. NBC_00344]|uniref:hypothetical protein n=1 Tax=Streptomyces sp. NBC_00344 TaxID=2975720 RepID=UPI002E217412